MDNGPLIGIMVSDRNSRKKTLKLYQSYNKLDMHLCTFTPTDILWKERRIIGLSLKERTWKQGSFPFPNAIYNRCFKNKILTINRLEKKIGKNKCFNSINHFNKWNLYNLLEQSSLKPYIPDTFLYNKVYISELIEKYKLLYIKPSYGSKGKTVYRVKLTDNGDIHIYLHSMPARYICRKKENIQEKMDEILKHNKYVIQQGILINKLNNQYFDIRTLVQKDISGEWKVSTITCRVAHENYYNTSMCESIYDVTEILPQILNKREMNKILKSLNEISIKAAQQAESYIGLLGEISVDFVLDNQGKLWIIELNGKPQKIIYINIKDFKDKEIIYSRPLEYAYYLSQSSKKEDKV